MNTIFWLKQHVCYFFKWLTFPFYLECPTHCPTLNRPISVLSIFQMSLSPLTFLIVLTTFLPFTFWNNYLRTCFILPSRVYLREESISGSYFYSKVSILNKYLLTKFVDKINELAFQILQTRKVRSLIIKYKNILLQDWFPNHKGADLIYTISWE